MRSRSVIVPLLLALLLLASQQFAALHAISHIGTLRAHAAGDKQLPAEQQCAQCLAFAHIGNALAAQAPQPPLFSGRDTCIGSPLPAPLFPHRIRAFDSRAPPALA